MKNLNQYENMMKQLDARIVSGGEVEAGANQVVILNGTELKPMPVRWLWPGWLAYGKLHLLAGAPGQGKTTIAMALGAVVTDGGKWPDGQFSPRGSILIWSGEDDPADTLLPRLLASGADCTKCNFVSGTRVAGEVRSFDLAKDLYALELAAQTIGDVKLIIVDPIVNAVTGDSHKNTEVRRDLQPLVDLAARLDAALLGITHFNKGGADRDPASRVMGSVAFTAFARIVMVAGKAEDADGQERRVLARAKSNIGSDNGGFAYDIEQVELEDDIWSSKIAWGDVLTGSARELLAEQVGEVDSTKRSAVDSAENFLRQILSRGPTPFKTIEKEAASAGVSIASVRRASDRMLIIKKKGLDHWYWQLPINPEDAQDEQEAQDRQDISAAASGPVAGSDLHESEDEHQDDAT